MITYKLKINYQDAKILQSDIEFVSGDVGAYLLECEFYDNGKRVDISGYSVALKAKRADGVILSEVGRIEENKGIISLNNDIYSVPGEVYLEIALLGNAKNYITTKIVIANVLEGLGETDETAKDKSSVYVTLLNQIKASIDSANSVLNEAKETENELKEALSTYAVKSTTLSGYGIADAYTKKEVDAIIEDYDTNLNVNRLPSTYAYKTPVRTSDLTEYTFDFSRKYNNEWRLSAPAVETISFVIPNGTYNIDFMSALSFDSGENPTSLVYTGSGILNWVGTDCVNFEGLSIFTPSANTHYDIVFYFNGNQFVGVVNGFVPATGNEAIS